jgi:hypothetical protein
MCAGPTQSLFLETATVRWLVVGNKLFWIKQGFFFCHLRFSKSRAQLKGWYTLRPFGPYYVGYPESTFRWAIEKKNYFQTIYIAI